MKLHLVRPGTQVIASLVPVIAPISTLDTPFDTRRPDFVGIATWDSACYSTGGPGPGWNRPSG
eukprot:1874620-Rhodomonas_salina.2